MNIVYPIAAAAVVLLACVLLWYLRRRQRSALEQVTQQLHRIAVGGSLRGRVELDNDRPELGLPGHRRQPPADAREPRRARFAPGAGRRP